MIVRFKCKSSGNVFSYENTHDIKTMREHPEYEEVKEIPVEDKKPIGRPPKSKNVEE